LLRKNFHSEFAFLKEKTHSFILISKEGVIFPQFFNFPDRKFFCESLFSYNRLDFSKQEIILGIIRLTHVTRD